MWVEAELAAFVGAAGSVGVGVSSVTVGGGEAEEASVSGGEGDERRSRWRRKRGLEAEKEADGSEGASRTGGRQREAEERVLVGGRRGDGE